MMIPYLLAIIKVKIIEYLCDCQCWTRLELFTKDVYTWLLAEPGLYRDVMMLDLFRNDIQGEAWLKYLDEKMYEIEVNYMDYENVMNRFDVIGDVDDNQDQK